MKKTIALLLCLVMIGALAACAQPTAAPTSTKAPDVTEAPKRVQWMLFQWVQTQNLDDPNLKYYQALNEWANIIIEPIIVPFDTYTDKFNATFASGDVPDLVNAVGMMNVVNENLGPAGLVVPISDHLDKMPSYKKYLDKYASQLPMITATDGKMYEVVLVRDYKSATEGLYIRQDKLKAGGMDPADIKTTDDLYAAFKILQEQNDGKPIMNFRWGLNRAELIASIFGGRFGIAWDPDTKKWYQGAITDNTKAGVEFLARLYKEGILAEDWASNTEELLGAAWTTGKLFAAYDNMMAIADFQNKKIDAVAIVPPTYQGKVWPRPYEAGPDPWMGNVISAKSEAIDNLLALHEFLFNEANQEFIDWGEEGVTFVTRSDGTKAYKEGMFWWGDPVNPLSEVYGCGWQESTCLLVPFERTYNESVLENDLTQSPWIPAYNAYSEAVWTYINPAYAFNKEELDILNNLRPALETYIAEGITQFISNAKPLSEWDAFVQGVKDYSSDRVVEIYNTATTRTNK